MQRHFQQGWQLGEPIGEEATAAFESAHGVMLPEPYRSFVALTANGATGPPSYGLVPLGEPAGHGGYAITSGSLARPFPLTEAWIWEDDENLDKGRQASVQGDGAVPLGTDGDGMDYVLVVSGASRGQVWMISDVGATPVAADFERWITGNVYPDAEWTVENRLGR